VVAGGVSANRHLRAQLAELMESLKGEVFYPRTEYCTDNGAMIAALGSQLVMAGRQPSGLGFGSESTLEVTQVQTP